MIVMDREKEDMASKKQILAEFKVLTEEVQQLLEANLLKTEMLPEEASPSAWETIRYLKGYSDALNDVAECFARMIERLKDAEEE